MSICEPVEYPDAVTVADLKEWSVEFEAVCARFEVCWSRPEPRVHFRQYLRGLLAPLERKNSWTIAEFAGELRTSSVERFISLSPWDADALRDEVRAYALEHFADERAVLICDPTGFAKKGVKSAGVQRQYSGTLGRIDNCQIGTFLAYANTRGDRVLIDRELYLPEKSWCQDSARRAAAGIPGPVVFMTRPQQVRAMVARALDAGVPFAWFAADEEFGQNPGLRAYLEESGIAYVMAVPKNTDTSTFSVDKYSADIVQELAAGLAERAWTRRACGIGSKGFRVYDWALVDSNTPGHQWVVRRSIDDGELAYFHCYNPRGDRMPEVVRAIGSRWPIEECFEAAKQEAGLDQYQFRLYHAWYRHITLSMLALAFLAALRRMAKKGTPPLWTEQPDLRNKQGGNPTATANHNQTRTRPT